nr:RNA-directed DNA polymerase, eukaryota [Tanacetum cinerariifolium]
MVAMVREEDKGIFVFSFKMCGRKEVYPRLFALERDKEIHVAVKLASLIDSFRRPVRGGVELQQLTDLVSLMDSVVLCSSHDRWRCDLSGDGDFSVKVIRNYIDDKFMPSHSEPSRWVRYIPIKINVFAGVTLDSVNCPLCNSDEEDIHHVLFRCEVATAVMRRVCRWWTLDWQPWSSFSDWNAWFSNVRFFSKVKRVLEGVFCVAWWSLWKLRNRTIFDASPPSRSEIFDDIVSLSFIVMSTSTYPFIVSSDSDIEDAFSSTILLTIPWLHWTIPQPHRETPLLILQMIYLNMSYTRHEEQIEDIFNNLDELSFDHIEEMKGHVNGRVIIQQDFDKLKTELQKARAQIAGLQRKKMRHNNKIAFARFKISTLELIIEDIQAAVWKLVDDSVATALEAQAATMTNTDNTNRNTREREAPLARKCSYKEFTRCQPFNFKGTEGVVGLIRSFERTKLVFSRSNCTEDYKVKFTTGTLTEEALSWWNSFA